MNSILKKQLIRFLKILVIALWYLRLLFLNFKNYGSRLINKFLLIIKKPLRDSGISRVNLKSLVNFRLTSVFRLSSSPMMTFKQIFSWSLSESTIKVRLLLVILGFLLCFTILSTRLIIVASTNLVESSKFFNKADMLRRDIVDRYGNLLAVNLPVSSLYAKPKKVVDAESTVEKLIKVFPELDKTKTLELLKSSKKFVWIKRDITPKQQEEIFNLGIPGLEFEREQKRIYTYGNLLSHILGYVGRDMEGLAGIEKYFDQLLTTQNEDKHSINSNLQLSIDVRVQNILSEEIEKTIKKFHAKSGAGIIVNPNNGEIVAMVSKPDFDPHYPGSATETELFNMVTQGAYEMGSGMKALTIAIGLDTSIVSMNDAYDLSYMKVGKFKVKDVHPSKGWNSLAQIFLNSSNIGVSQIMLEVGKSNLRDYLKRLKLLEKLEIELPERARPLFPPYNRWNDLSLVTMSYGYSISESPAHFVQAMIPLVNGGVMYPLTLIKGQNDKITGERVFSETTSKSIRQLMRIVVAEGTGRKAEVKGYYIGGKTGTAEKAIGGKYYKNKRMSSFFGIIPASNPKYLLYVIFDEPQGIKETFGFAGGGWTAAPTAGAIFERLAVLYVMNKLDENAPEIQELLDIDYIIDKQT